jgi:hypothetical protein
VTTHLKAVEGARGRRRGRTRLVGVEHNLAIDWTRTQVPVGVEVVRTVLLLIVVLPIVLLMLTVKSRKVVLVILTGRRVIA